MSKGSTFTICSFYIISLYDISVNAATYYEASTRVGTYRQVRGNCMNNGGDLAKFDSLADVEKLYNLCEATGAPGRGCYVGFNDLQRLNVWRWVDGPLFDQYDYVDSSGFETSSWDRCGGVFVDHDIATPIEDLTCDWSGGGIYGICEYPIDVCDCFDISLISANVERTTGNQCYQYEVSFCNELDTVRFGMQNADNSCGFDLEASFVSIQPPSLGVNLITSGPPMTRGIEISGLEDGDRFRMCFRGPRVEGTSPGGNVEFDDGEDADGCPVVDLLPDFCGGFAAETGNDALFMPELEGKDTVNEEPMMMQFVWAAMISAVVSMMVVFVAYMVCIKPLNKTQVYDKLVLDEEEKDMIST